MTEAPSDWTEPLREIAEKANDAEWVSRPLRENDFEHFAIGVRETETGFAIIGYVDRLTALQKRDHIVAFQPKTALALIDERDRLLRERDEAVGLLEKAVASAREFALAVEEQEEEREEFAAGRLDQDRFVDFCNETDRAARAMIDSHHEARAFLSSLGKENPDD